MAIPKKSPLPLMIGLTIGLAGSALSQDYRAFDWEGQAAPAQPAGAGAVTHTTYLTGAQYRDDFGALQQMSLEVEVTVLLWDAPQVWRVDNEGFLAGGAEATYGYQSPDEAEFRFGGPVTQARMRFDFHFSEPVDNPSFFLMDIDNNGSDVLTAFSGTQAGGGTVFPSMSVALGSVVSFASSGPTMEVFSPGPAVSDQMASGVAFFEWHADNVTDLSFVWEGYPGSSIRMSNLMAETNPEGFSQVAAAPVPEPSTCMTAAVFLGGLMMRRRR